MSTNKDLINALVDIGTLKRRFCLNQFRLHSKLRTNAKERSFYSQGGCRWTIIPSCKSLPILLAAIAMCSVAMGRLDIYHESNVKLWDYAAAYLIGKSHINLEPANSFVAVTEADGVVQKSDSPVQLELGDSSLIVGNEILVPKFRNLLSVSNPNA